MSPTSRERLDIFWELLDEILNAVLFVMIGLELLRLNFNITYAWATALAIPAVLAARFLSVGLAALVPDLRQDFPPYVIGILTWAAFAAASPSPLRSRFRQGLIVRRSSP